VCQQQSRNLSLHEYMSIGLLREAASRCRPGWWPAPRRRRTRWPSRSVSPGT
ncbi:unnamed protein product, partial [Tetraodon nigroviridis]